VHREAADHPRALALIGRIYDAALQPAMWPQVMLQVVDYVEGTKGLLFTSLLTLDDGGFAFPYKLPESFLQLWNAKYSEHDLWSSAALRLGKYHGGTVVLDSDLVPEEEFVRSVAHREILGPAGIGRLCSGVVFGPGKPETPATVCSVFRNLSDAAFGEEERARMQILVAHLSRALGVMYRLRDAELKSAATLAALDRLSCGVVLLDSLGRVTHLNRTMKRLLGQSDGLRLRALRPGSAYGRLVADTNPERLEQAVDECLRTDALRVPMFSAGVTIPRASGGRDYLVQMSPLPGSKDFAVDSRAARVILFVSDPDAPAELDGALLKRLYGLTPVEIRLAGFLYGGKTLADAAELASTSQAAARSQLRRVFDKTGTSRQADLARLLAGLHSTRSD